MSSYWATTRGISSQVLPSRIRPDFFLLQHYPADRKYGAAKRGFAGGYAETTAPSIESPFSLLRRHPEAYGGRAASVHGYLMRKTTPAPMLIPWPVAPSALDTE